MPKEGIFKHARTQSISFLLRKWIKDVIQQKDGLSWERENQGCRKESIQQRRPIEGEQSHRAVTYTQSKNDKGLTEVFGQRRNQENKAYYTDLFDNETIIKANRQVKKKAVEFHVKQSSKIKKTSSLYIIIVHGPLMSNKYID